MYEELVDEDARKREQFTMEFVENLHASLTDRQLEEPDQLQQVCVGAGAGPLRFSLADCDWTPGCVDTYWAGYHISIKWFHSSHLHACRGSEPLPSRIAFSLLDLVAFIK